MRFLHSALVAVAIAAAAIVAAPRSSEARPAARCKGLVAWDGTCASPQLVARSQARSEATVRARSSYFGFGTGRAGKDPRSEQFYRYDRNLYGNRRR